MQFINENAVVTANKFNLSVISQIWLVRSGVVDEDDWEAGSIFTPALIQFATPSFGLLLVEDRLQVIPRGNGDHQEVVSRVIGRIVETLPHTPFTGIGINFTWHLASGRHSPYETQRALFFQANGPLGQEFDCADARYGAYYSRDVGNIRLKLNALPITINSPNGREERTQFLFNFHADVTDAGQIMERLNRWNELKEQATSLISRVEESHA